MGMKTFLSGLTGMKVGKTMASSHLPNQAAKYIGMRGRPNKFSKWYAGKHGKQFLEAPWCAMFLSFCASELRLGKVVGEYAYCPYWVEWFKERKRWGSTPKVGALVFFDWNKDKRADHVGVVEAVKGEKVYTIEGNKNNSVQRVIRSNASVLGYGYPAYPTSTKPQFHVVLPGDSLIAIARHYYGNPLKWRDVYQANKKTIGKDPALIKPGMKLVLP